MLDSGSVVTADDLLITSGCHNALSLALLSVCHPGDIVAVESPCYYGTMQILRGLGLKAIEIPTDPESGISIEALELALDQWPIKGVILVPNCNNPLGYIMPDARKRAVLSLAQRHDIVIFEDDIYGELATEYPRPRTIHSWDIDGRVILCSSFTKTIAPGLRIGWIAPGRYYDRLLQMKYAASGTNVPSTQLAACKFIREAITTATCGGCGRSISVIWRSTPAGCGSFSPAASASPGQKAALCCGSSYRSRWIWSASPGSCVG